VDEQYQSRSPTAGGLCRCVRGAREQWFGSELRFKDIKPAQDQISYHSLRFKIISKSSSTSAYVQRVRTAADGAIAGVLISSNNKLGYRNDVTGSSNTTGPTVTLNVWHEVQTHLHIDAATPANGQIEVWYDGALVPALSVTGNFSTSAIGRIRVGDSQASDIYDVALDEVGVNTSLIDTTDSSAHARRFSGGSHPQCRTPDLECVNG
jgi:hypothetical protein